MNRQEKICSDCHKPKSLREFYKNKNCLDGHVGRCVQCQSIVNHKKYICDPFTTKLRAALWNKENPERRRQIVRKSDARPEAKKAKLAGQAKRYWANIESSRARMRTNAKRLYLNNPERERTRSRNGSRRRFERDPVGCRMIARLDAHIRRARLRNTFIEKVTLEGVLARYGSNCYLCREDVVPPASGHLEHVIPLCKGGEHSYVNIRLAHRLCNIKKASKIDFSTLLACPDVQVIQL